MITTPEQYDRPLLHPSSLCMTLEMFLRTDIVSVTVSDEIWSEDGLRQNLCVSGVVEQLLKHLGEPLVRVLPM